MGYRLEYPNVSSYSGLFETPIDTLLWGNCLICSRIYCYCMFSMEVLEGREELLPVQVFHTIFKKFLTIPLILNIITSYFYADRHIKTLHKKNGHSHSTSNDPTARGNEGGKALCWLLWSRKRQLCCHIKQINRKVRRKKKINILLHWIDLRVSACCWRNRFFHLLGSHFYKCMRWAPIKAHQERSIFHPSLFFSFHPILLSPPPLCQADPDLSRGTGGEDTNPCPPWGRKSCAPGLWGVWERNGDCSQAQERKIPCLTSHNYLGLSEGKQ